MFLETIVTYKKEEIQSRKKTFPLSGLKREAQHRTPRRDFFKALNQACGNTSRIIAEIKKASPSQGIIRENCVPQEIGKIYQRAGAAAISILTEKKFFQGDISYLSLVRKSTDIPLLCKDFIIDPYQIYEAALQWSRWISFNCRFTLPEPDGRVFMSGKGIRDGGARGDS